MMSLSHQKPADQEVPYYLGSPQLSDSQCKLKAASVDFSVTDFHANFETAERFGQPPKIACFGNDGEEHRCKVFPCPDCHPGRNCHSYAPEKSHTLDTYSLGAVLEQRRQGHHEAGTILFGDGGHTCRRFPCPVCGNGRSAALGVEVGC